MSRSKDLKGYIKHGCEEALIEIELQGDGGDKPNPVVKRRLARSGANEWVSVLFRSSIH